jgi:hypothetical protein
VYLLNNGPETDFGVYNGQNNGQGLTLHTAQVSVVGWLWGWGVRWFLTPDYLGTCCPGHVNATMLCMPVLGCIVHSAHGQGLTLHTAQVSAVGVTHPGGARWMPASLATRCMC